MNQYFCFDIGASFIKYGILQEDGNVLFQDKSPTNSHLGADELTDRLLKIIEQMKIDYEARYIAVATTGIVDTQTGSIMNGISGMIDGYEGLPLKAFLEERTGLTTEVGNDVNCFGLAENWMGSAKGYRNCVCITIGTGIGGALLIDGQVYYGSGNMAMEVGRMPIAPSTLEDLASVRALAYEYAKLCNIPAGDVDGLLVAKRERLGDPLASKAFDIMCYYLAQGIAAIVSMLTPDVIVIGGAITNDWDIINSRLLGNLEGILDKALYKTLNIKYTQLGSIAGLIGSLRHHQMMTEKRNAPVWRGSCGV